MSQTEVAPKAELLEQLRRLGAPDDLARAHPVDIAEALNLLDPRVAGRALSSLPFDLAVRVLEQPEFDRRASSSDLKAKNRTKAVAFPRQVAMYLARHLTHASLAEVGRAFGGKDHTTVLHAVAKIQTLMREDPTLHKTIERLIQGIHL